MAAPVAIFGSARYGVSVGISQSFVPRDPGAPSGQSTTGFWALAREFTATARNTLQTVPTGNLPRMTTFLSSMAFHTRILPRSQSYDAIEDSGIRETRRPVCASKP